VRGVANGGQDTPPVLLQVRHPDGFVERAEKRMAIGADAVDEALSGPGERRLTPTPAGSDSSVTYAALSEALTFLGPLLDDLTEITGREAARMYVPPRRPMRTCS
jgi:hypothetical protein